MCSSRNLPPLRGLDSHAGDVEGGVIGAGRVARRAVALAVLAVALLLGSAVGLLWIGSGDESLRAQEPQAFGAAPPRAAPKAVATATDA